MRLHASPWFSLLFFNRKLIECARHFASLFFPYCFNVSPFFVLLVEWKLASFCLHLWDFKSRLTRVFQWWQLLQTLDVLALFRMLGKYCFMGKPHSIKGMYKLTFFNFPSSFLANYSPVTQKDVPIWSESRSGQGCDSSHPAFIDSKLRCGITAAYHIGALSSGSPKSLAPTLERTIRYWWSAESAKRLH